jgi:putative hydrolase of the HAD superfamily
MTIKAITFDFWQTLYENSAIDYNQRIGYLKSEIERAAGLSFAQAKFEAGVKVARDAWNRAWVQDYRTPGAAEWLAILLQYLGVSLAAEQIQPIQSWMEHGVLTRLPVLAPQAREMLAGLSARYSLAIISDTGLTPGRVLRQILEADNIIGYFAHLTFSDELGRSKPHPDAFLTTLAALEADPAEAIHIGDLLRTDIAGAQGVGMRGVQYIGLNYDKHAENGITPDAIIRHHTELESLLQQWNNGG